MAGPAAAAVPYVDAERGELLPSIGDHARRVVCARAADAGEARMLLQMLGLVPSPSDRPAELTAVQKAAQKTIEDARRRGPVTAPRLCEGGCGKMLRPQRVAVALHPGTVGEVALRRCSGCYRALRAQADGG